ncbi:MAG: histidine phosphatase family protein [Chloroflexi bacterium]|nr:histidine phosphatase family protein [Chloroflexota bacterium]
MHLLLVRHGQSYVNLDDWQNGYVDIGLTPLGQQQAELVSLWLAKHIQITALYTSTMARAIETTAYVTRAAGVVAQPDDRIREYGNCHPDGRPLPPEAMPVKYPDYWSTTHPYKLMNGEGESWMMFRARVGAFIDDVLARHAGTTPESTVVVVCHGGVIDAVFDFIINNGAYRRMELLTYNTGITHWEYNAQSTHEPWGLRAHNMTYHLAATNGHWAEVLGRVHVVSTQEQE